MLASRPSSPPAANRRGPEPRDDVMVDARLEVGERVGGGWRPLRLGVLLAGDRNDGIRDCATGCGRRGSIHAAFLSFDLENLDMPAFKTLWRPAAASARGAAASAPWPRRRRPATGAASALPRGSRARRARAWPWQRPSAAPTSVIGTPRLTAAPISLSRGITAAIGMSSVREMSLSRRSARPSGRLTHERDALAGVLQQVEGLQCELGVLDGRDVHRRHQHQAVAAVERGERRRVEVRRRVEHDDVVGRLGHVDQLADAVLGRRARRPRGAAARRRTSMPGLVVRRRSRSACPGRARPSS